MKIHFYNGYHNGDIHYSRGFVSHAIDRVKAHRDDVDFYYHHLRHPSLLQDINLESSDHFAKIALSPQFASMQAFALQEMKDSLFVNMWVGNGNSSGHKWMDLGSGCTFMSNAYMWQHALACIYEWAEIDEETFGMDDPPRSLLPRVDYDRYDLENARSHLQEAEASYRKKVFISNGNVLSGQSINHSFDDLIKNLANENKDVIFYHSNPADLPEMQNVVWTPNVIKCDTGCDLNENGYLASECDIILGRASGSFCFAGTENVFMDESKTMISSAHNREEAFWYTGGKCKYLHHMPDEGMDSLFTLVSNELGA